MIFILIFLKGISCWLKKGDENFVPGLDIESKLLFMSFCNSKKRQNIDMNSS